jgi:L-asparaginase
MRRFFSTLYILLLCFQWAAAELPKIVVVTTGGTIAETEDPTSGGAVPTVSGTELLKAVPELEAIADLEVVEFSNVDSSQMAPENWASLSRRVDGILKRPDVVGVVVTHGTDTMAEGAFFLQTTLQSDKPVVFTGAMNDASSPRPDGPGNLTDAVTVAGSETARDWGVTIVLNRYVNGAWAAHKTQTTNPQTFQSGEWGYLGYVYNGEVRRFNSPPARVRLPLPTTLPKVVYITSYAGADGSLIRFAVDSGAQGLVIDGVGAGNINSACYKQVQYALSKGVPVVISTRVPHGSVEPIYGGEGGSLTLQKAGCILAGEMRGPKARLLLMLALAQTQDRTQLRRYFSRPLKFTKYSHAQRS